VTSAAGHLFRYVLSGPRAIRALNRRPITFIHGARRSCRCIQRCLWVQASPKVVALGTRCSKPNTCTDPARQAEALARKAEMDCIADMHTHREIALKEIQLQHAGHDLKEAIERFHKSSSTDFADFTDKRQPGSMKSAKSAKSVDRFFTIDFRQLLGRFIDVYNAVAYAHSRGVLSPCRPAHGAGASCGFYEGFQNTTQPTERHCWSLGHQRNCDRLAPRNPTV
jgi:hypothetical protein